MTNATNVPKRFRRLSEVESATHAFEVGQAVHLNNGFSPSGNVYRIIAKLPPIGDSPQYHIQNEVEKFQRMAAQSSLELVISTADGKAAPLVDRTFRSGPKALTQPMLSPKVEAAIRVGSGSSADGTGASGALEAASIPLR
jgi:hypothetical protein